MSGKHAQFLEHGSPAEDGDEQPSWRLKLSQFRMPERVGSAHASTCFRRLFSRTPRKQENIADYYRRQQMLIESFSEMDSMNEYGHVPGGLTKDEMEHLARSERMAIHASNIANMVLFAAKLFASFESGSLAVIASTLDSFLDLLSGFILWFTSNAMRKPNYKLLYPIGKGRMQQVGILVFATAMATLGIQIIIESGRQLKNGQELTVNHNEEMWMIGIMISVTVVKFVLMVYCRKFKNEIVRAYAQDHFFDVITNSIGLVTATLAIKYEWWIDPVGAMVIALYTITTWARTVLENANALIAKAAPPAFLSKVTYLVWNHHEEIQHIDTVRAYALGSHYFVEVDIVLPQNMMLANAHDIGETLQEKLENLPKVERAFVHIDYDYTHSPEHKSKVK